MNAPKGVAAVALGWALAACSGGGSHSYQLEGGGTVSLISASDRHVVAGVSGTTLTGAHLDLSTWRGHVVVVNVWGSWCPPCRTEAQYLVAVAAKTASAGVKFVGIDIEDNAAAARAFDATHGVTYPSIVDRSFATALHFSPPPGSPPTTIVLDRSGREAARVTGGVTYSGLLDVIHRVAGEAAA